MSVDHAMRKEYDFSQGTRGKHAKQTLRIVGDPARITETAVKIQQIIELDLKSREDFGSVWSELNQAERKIIRADWLKKITTVLEQ